MQMVQAGGWMLRESQEVFSRQMAQVDFCPSKLGPTNDFSSPEKPQPLECDFLFLLICP